MQRPPARCPDWATFSVYPNIRLLVFNGANQVGCVSIAQGKHFVFGSLRGPSVDIPVEDPQGSVEDPHCSIAHHTTGRPFLIDHNTRHGTLLTPANGKRAARIAPQKPILLEEGCIINIGLSPTYFVLRGSVSTDPAVDEPLIVCTPEVYRNTLRNCRLLADEGASASVMPVRPPRPRKAVHWAAEIERSEPTRHHAMAGSETRIDGVFGESGRVSHLAFSTDPLPLVGRFQHLVAEPRLERPVRNVGQATRSPVFTFSAPVRPTETPTAALPTSPTIPQSTGSWPQAEPQEPLLPTPPRKRRRFPLPPPPSIPPPPPPSSRRTHFFPPLVFKSRDTGPP